MSVARRERGAELGDAPPPVAEPAQARQERQGRHCYQAEHGRLEQRLPGNSSRRRLNTYVKMQSA